MLLHQPIVMPNMVHVSNVAWLQTIRLEVVKVRLVVRLPVSDGTVEAG